MTRFFLDRLAPSEGKWSKILIPAVFLSAGVFTKLQSGPAATDIFPVLIVLCATALLGLIVGAVAYRLPRIPCAFLLIVVIGVSLDIAFSLENKVASYLMRHWIESRVLRVGSIAILIWGTAICLLLAMGQKRWKALLACAAGYFIASIFTVHALPSELPVPKLKESQGPLGRVVVEILLDEHIGPLGIPQDIAVGPEMRRAITDFYTSRGFKIYSAAYSPFTFTAASVPAMLNLDDPDPVTAIFVDLFRRWSEPMKWFGALKEAGYRTVAYTIGSSWNLCASGDPMIDDCRIYDPVNRNREGPLGHRVEQYFVLAVQNTMLDKTACAFFDICSMEKLNLGTNSVEVLGQVSHEIEVSTGDTAIFVHALIPHHPQRLNEDCVPHYFSDPRNEAELFEHYFAQIRCTMRTVDAIVQAIDRRGALDRATIIVHGDHGLRPGDRNGAPDRLRLMAHSTLFAVRTGSEDPGIDTVPYRVQTLIPHYLVGTPLIPGNGMVWKYRDNPNSERPIEHLTFPQ